MTKLASRSLAFVLLTLSCGALSYGQSGSGTIRGLVLDPSGATVKGATVEILHPVSHYQQSVKTDGQGAFEFDNAPLNNYHLTVKAAGFQSAEQDVDLRSAIPVEVKVTLKIGAETTSVTVTGSSDLLEIDPTTHTDVDRNLFDKLPLESQSSSLSSLVTLASPGVSADSNGNFHGLGDHAENAFSVDGQPINDQQSKVFSNQIPLDSVQSMEVIEGAPPAEYGDKTSLVIVVTTRSGMGMSEPHGEINTSFGSFGTYGGGANLAWGGKNWGNFVSLSGLNTSRFLDGPELTVMHDHGNQQNFFDRFDLKPSSKDTINVNFGLTRSWFQTPNSFDSQTAGAWSGLVVDNGGLGPDGKPVGSTDQVSKIRTFNIAPSWTRLLNENTVFTFGGFARQDQYNYYPSADPFADLIPNLQTNSIGQSRRLTNLGLRSSLSMVRGIHNIKIGFTWQQTILTENDSFGIVDPTFNPVCMNPDGSPVTNPALTNPANCTKGLQVNPGFDPLLACYDLTRTGKLPGSDGCPNTTSGLYTFNGHANVREEAFYAQDTINLKNWTFSIGLRADFYNGITKMRQAEPRAGIAYHIKPTGTVLQISYARTLETPFNENLVLASQGCNDAVINDLSATLQGYLVYFALGCALLTFAITRDARATISVIIVAGACGIAAGTPLAVLGAIGRAARNGAIIKGGLYLEALGKIDTVAFDKTGTLTLGKPRVTYAHPANNITVTELIQAAAIAERKSEHPLAQAVLDKAAELSLPVVEPDEFNYTLGKGIACMVNGDRILVGNSAFFRDQGVGLLDSSTTNGNAISEILVACAGRMLGVIGVADMLRPDAGQAIASLHAMGLRTVLITGDSRAVAEAVARELRIDDVQAELLPEQKSQRVRALRAEGRNVAMIGDGINDAPALTEANVGVAMGAGTDVARDSADIVLIGNDLLKFVETVKIARWCRSIIMTNFAGTLVVDGIGVGLAAFGFLNPLLAALIHVVSELVFILNSARLLPAMSRERAHDGTRA